ncbi:hypothetical protein [Glutamicibacter sp. PS]|uniref:hypothetical protein n=1 Tax=Glutamicibacter sp. PS TaxID=3075634 RepID=UPI00283B7CD2|nr:hypothetical protein [Glutamicibacter sp. PS]MDR4533243.1 hypothetical protein [Glutamicibacter sp. PS]
MNDTDSLKGLVEIAVERHDTSVRQLAAKAHDAGFKVTYTTLHQIRSGKYKSAPGEQTVRAIAYLAGVEESVAFAAAGQPVPGPPLADELPPGADNLSPKSRKAVVDMVRVLVDLEAQTNAQHEQHPQDKPPRSMRSVATADHPGKGQKSETYPRPNDIELDIDRAGIPQLHGNEAQEHPLPPLEQLAAHPYFESEREKFDRIHGTRGEDHQNSEVDP